MTYHYLALSTILIPSLASGQQSVSPTAGMERLSQEHAIYFSGRVLQEGGSPPPEPVLIQRVCPGSTRNEGTTDSAGQYAFKVEPGSVSGGLDDATKAAGPPSDVTKPFGNSTQYSNPITTLLRNCEIRVAASGFRTENLRIATQNIHEAVRLPDIVLHKLTHGDELAVSVTTLSAPPAAAKAYQKGDAAEREQKWNEAAASFSKAVKIYPQFADAWFELGISRQHQSDSVGAEEAWKRAAQADPKFVKPLQGLTALADAKQDWVASEHYSGQWIALDRDNFPQAYLFHAIAEARLNKPDEAEKDARTALRLDKQHAWPRISYVLGLILLSRHSYAESAQCFRDYLAQAPQARDAAVVKTELARIEQLQK